MNPLYREDFLNKILAFCKSVVTYSLLEQTIIQFLHVTDFNETIMMTKNKYIVRIIIKYAFFLYPALNIINIVSMYFIKTVLTNFKYYYNINIIDIL